MAEDGAKGKGGEDVAFESSAFEALERDFQEVLQEYPKPVGTDTVYQLAGDAPVQGKADRRDRV